MFFFYAVQKEARGRNLVEKIRKGGAKDEKQKTNAARAQVDKKTVKQRKMYIGWLHRSSVNSKFKQVRLKDGGGLREFTYSDDDEISVDFLKANARKLFFPEQRSKFGALDDMCLHLGNYAQERITEFTDIDGKTCTFQEYLKSRGLFASRFNVYLMSTFVGEGTEGPANDASQEEAHRKRDTFQFKTQDVFMGAGETQISGDFKNLAATSTPKTSAREESQSHILVLKNQVGKSPFPYQTVSDNKLYITYESATNSSYADVVLRVMSSSRAQCYDVYSFEDPTIRDMALNDFDPLDFGFNVVDISKGEKYSLQRSDDPTSEEGFKVVFPNADAQSSSLILHPPSEVWGYDDKQLILGVVSSCHMSSNAWYVWYRDGIQIKAGNKHCCLPVSSPGSYHIAVHCGEQKTTSEPVLVCDFSDLGPPSVSAFDTSAKANVPQLPVVEKGEINFSAKDELGRGSFGVVYKGVWAGTEVAVKHVKIRNAKRLQTVVETEVRIHSMIRHPNIVQIMAISYLKNSIYLVSELINGRNLEELLFNDDENSDIFTLQSCNKYDVGKQVSLAVAYLHNLKPPLLHCDIKPANVLVAEKTHITKLCNMGLSKLKSAQSLTHTTSSAIRGTPSYMAPECLLERKKAAVHSDVWSLACTLVELFTERECWEQLLEGKEEAAGRKSDDAESDVESLIAIMRKKECPRSIEFLPETVDASLRGILVDCFKYETELRPRAIDLVNAFP